MHQRAVWLAALFFNRQNGVRVTEWKQDDSLDLVVTLPKEEHAPSRFLGVVAVGVLSIEELPAKYNAPKLAADFYSVDAMPTLQLAFTMPNDQGFYRWVQEPTPDGIQAHPDGEWEALSDATLAPVVARVSAWYDAQTEQRK